MIKFMKVNYNGIAQRYMHNKNFENEHPTYKLAMSEGKLLNAYEYTKTLKIDDNVYVNSLVAVELDK